MMRLIVEVCGRGAVVLAAGALVVACATERGTSSPAADASARPAKTFAAAASASGKARPAAPAATAQQQARAGVGTEDAASDAGGPAGGPPLGTSTFEAPGVTPAPATGTHVGQKVEELRADLARLQARVADHNAALQSYRTAARRSSGAYHNLVADMNQRLQLGTTPGNPELVAQWNQAQAELNRVGESIASLTTLSNEASATSGLAAFLLEGTRATLALRGAVEEDHRQLRVLDDEINKTLVVIDRLLNELTGDVARTQNYFTAERANLTAMQVAIDNGEYIGGTLAGRAYGVPPPPPPGGAAALVGQRQPLVVIRFNEDKVNYEQALFSAISRALERKPNAGFDLVAVASDAGTPAQVSLATSRSRRNAEGVLRALTNMGLPSERVTLSETSSASVQASEVHVYVR